MSNNTTLSEAAALIRENAECLRACHATPAGGWSDSDAEVKEHYEYELSLADRLEALAPVVDACAGVPTEILQSWINPPDGQMGLPHGPWHRHLVALGAQRARLGNLLERFLAIDDWTDDSIAPPELIAEAKDALAELEGLTIEAAA